MARALAAAKRERLESFLSARMRTMTSLLGEFGNNVLQDMRRSGLRIQWATRWRPRGGVEVVYWIGNKPRSVRPEDVQDMNTSGRVSK